MTQPDDTTLHPCPICGADKGYRLAEGDSYRWWSVCCAACAMVIAEARNTAYPSAAPQRTAGADAAWDEAGAHAAGLRDEVERLRNRLRELGDIAAAPPAVPPNLCPRCSGEMRPGIAMGQTYSGSADFPGGKVCTVSPGGPGKIIGCNKCAACGHSVAPTPAA